MDEPTKNVSDSAFAAHVLAEQALLKDQGGCLTAAERAAVRELLGFLAVLRQMVADERFQQEASARIGKWRDIGKAWLLAFGALVGVAVSLITAYKTLGG